MTEKKTLLEKENKNNSKILIIMGSYESFLFGLSLKEKIINEQFIFKAHDSSIRTLAIDKKSKYLITGGQDEFIRIWNLKSRRELNNLNFHSGNITKVIILDNRYFLSCSEDSLIVLWSLKTFEIIKVFKSHTQGIVDIDVHGSQKIFFSVDKTGLLILWNLMTCKKASSIQLFKIPDKIKFSVKGDLYCLIYKDFSSEVFHISSTVPKFKVEHDLKESAVSLLWVFIDDVNKEFKTIKTEEERFLRDLEFLILGLENGILLIIFIKNDELIKLKFKAHLNRIKDLGFKNKTLFTICSDGYLKCWDFELILYDFINLKNDSFIDESNKYFITEYKSDCRLICLAN